jgi:hypothetical protein
MSYKKISRSDAPKRNRKAMSGFEKTPEWQMMKADIDKGLKPNDALQVVFSERDKEKYNIRTRRSIARAIQKYLRTQDRPYTVKSFERRETGDFVILVQCAARR